MLTEEVEPTAGNDSVTETPAPPGPAATAPKESKSAAAATSSSVGTTLEAQKLTYVLSEFHFDQLNIEAGLKDQLASLVSKNLDKFA